MAEALPTTAADEAHAGQATRVIAVRHGETAWNVETRMQGQLDIPLNDKGRWQAARVAAALADEALDAIYSSDLLRASETAEALACAQGRRSSPTAACANAASVCSRA